MNFSVREEKTTVADDNKQVIDKINAPKKKAKGIMVGVVIVILALLVIILGFGYHYVQDSLKPLNPKSQKLIQVKVPI